MLQRILALLMLGFVPLLGSAGVQITDIRTSTAEESSRVVLDLTGPARHKFFTLNSPDRVVVDLPDTRLAGPVAGLTNPVGHISKIRTGVRDNNTLRLVIEVNAAVKVSTLLLNPESGSNYRLVVDLNNPQTSAKPEAQPEPKAVEPVQQASPPAAEVELAKSVTPPAVGKARDYKPAKTIAPPIADKGRDIIVAIDAGHGGKDPGAKGPKGTEEKDVVLDIARKLAGLVNKERGMKAVLIRNDDRFISLRERTEIARDHKADLFISIHADAFQNAYAKGSSVFVLSERGATSEAAKWLAANENAADLVGGIRLDDKDEMLRSVLLDLSQTASIEASIDVADKVLDQLKQIGNVHKQNVEQAGFVVLKAPDIPSILVETAFISNPAEERRLRDPRHQMKVAQSIFKGLKTYFQANPPPGTVLAMRDRQHVISNGETLSRIAEHYRININELRSANALSGDAIREGQVLYIPSDNDS